MVYGNDTDTVEINVNSNSLNELQDKRLAGVSKRKRIALINSVRIGVKKHR